MPTMDNKLSKPSPPDLSKRRTTWTFIRALMWKNWTIKNRQPIATTCEILVPTFFILLLGFLKLLTTSVDVPPGWSDDADNTAPTRYNLFQPTGTSINWVDADLPKFAQHESTLTGLILKLGLQSINDGMRLAELSSADLVACKNGVLIEGYVDANVSSIFRVLPECAEKVSPYKIAIAPDNTFTRKYFMETMELWYPRKTLGNSSASSLTIPSFKESVQFFASDEALTDYIKSDEYGKGLDNPRIYAGIVFESIPSDEDIGSFASIEYSLRLNSTRGRIGEAVGRVASTGGSVEDVSPFQKDIVTDYYSRYAVTGFMTLQTLVTRFVTCMPEWISSNESVRSSCQSPQATALPSIESDDNLLNALGSDGLIKEFIQALGMGNTTAVNILSQTSVEAKELLLVPLRQAPQSVLGSVIAPFPIDSYTSSPFYDQVSEVFSIMFIMAYLFTLSRLLVVLIEEKELRLREFMKILGVTEKVITMTWYATYAVILFIGAAFGTSDVLVLLPVWNECASDGIFAEYLFSKARVGVFVGMVVFFLMYAISQGFSDETSEGVKTIGSVLSPVALSFGVTVLASAEETGDGVRFSNMNTLSNNFRISTALWMFALDTVLYTILGLYFERIIPKQYGTMLKWYFPVSPSYWRKRNQKNVFDQAQDALLENVSLDVNPNFEPVSSELREQEISGDALCVQRLRKVFDVPGGEKVAVKGLNLVMYRDQITCLLGHNGAGKTTLISMLTGMTAPSSGNASFQGMTLTDDMDDLRQSLGLCFQHDALFPELTVQEHLLFFGQIKGYSSDKLPEVVEKQIQEVGLTEKRHAKPNDLSGGMKRKLSVAISLLGDSALVFLDEPTSGMDPYSRRSVWDILQNNRNGRVMVLTTHFMDEADILGDRIAIMAECELRCSGSSLFLKNRFGAGYNLTVVKDDERCDDKELVAFISSYVPSSQVLSNVGSEIAFQLSLDSSPLFAEMFAELDRQSKQLGVLSCGVSGQREGVGPQCKTPATCVGRISSGVLAIQLHLGLAHVHNSMRGDACASECLQHIGAHGHRLFQLHGSDFPFGDSSVCAIRARNLPVLEHASAQTYTIVLNFVIGMVLMITSFILDLIDSTEGVNSVLKFFWRFSPLFSLGNALLNMVNSEFDSIRSSDDGGTSPFDPDMMGFEMIYLVFTIVFFFGLTLHLDYAKAVKKTDSLESSNENFDPDYEVDEDVRQEALRVASGGADHDAVKLKELRKVYPGGKVAVRNLSFGLKRGECFGFLGINGAGKTTTMKMLTGDVIPTQGSATLGGFDILTQQADVRRQIGYCPQFDALFDLLSVREHLELFGAIKGVPISQLDAVVQDKILQLNLSDFEHKLAGSLSGGNKRKLSVAIAMIGNPAIIFLDEPSTGMDPVSRRFMWDVIADISTRGKESTIVLTTHSMEECEALCSTVGIMVGGRLRCLGSVQHLKSRFGDGLMIDVKLETPSTSELDSLVDRVFGLDNMHIIPADIEERCRDFGNADLATRITSDHPTGFNLAAAIESEGFVRAEAFISWCVGETRFDTLKNYLVGSFDSANVVVLERQNDFCRLKITESGGKVELSRMFALVEQVKSKMHIREYSVSQTTLEQIFNSFASQQEEELGVARGMTA
ncbi:ABC transporter A family member 1 [Phytophthora nicotianae]|uniref:ABC transporter A family member 1 n=2 Tax=Phytophthora nicotianae TaxID=4792 RepID=A0A0W8DHW0_PHYNI|nr:ABC transporter A family member 1 [Phytophthora nicotianae]